MLTVPMRGVQSVAVLVLVKTGSRFESRKVNGISHLLEHMAFKGTKKRPTTTEIASLMDGVGAEFNAYTSKEYTGYWIKVAGTHLPLAMDVLSDILLNSLYDEEELRREEGVVIEEINMYEDTPMRNIGDVFEELIFKGSSLGWRIAGSKESVRTVTRSDIVSYVRQQYSAEDMVVGIAGNENNLKATEKLVSNYFGKFKSGKDNKYLPAEFKQKTPAFYHYPKKTDQSHFIIGLRSFPYGHPDRYNLAVLNTVLGASMSSRLWIEVRERRGLCYYVRSGVEEFMDNGYLGIQAGVTISRIEEAVKVILSELDKIRAKPVSADELQRAKENWKGKMILTLEDSHSVASMYTHQELLEGRIEEPDEILRKIDQVTAEDMQRVANEIIRNKGLNMAVIGPYDAKQASAIEKVLQL